MKLNYTYDNNDNLKINTIFYLFFSILIFIIILGVSYYVDKEIDLYLAISLFGLTNFVGAIFSLIIYIFNKKVIKENNNIIKDGKRYQGILLSTKRNFSPRGKDYCSIVVKVNETKYEIKNIKDNLAFRKLEKFMNTEKIIPRDINLAKGFFGKTKEYIYSCIFI